MPSVDLDVARWNPDVGDALDDLRTAQRRGIDDDELPGSWPARARDVLAQARQLARCCRWPAGRRRRRGRRPRGRGARPHPARPRPVVRRARVAAYNAQRQTP